MAEDRVPESRRRIPPAESDLRRRIGRELITFPEFHPPVRRIVAGGDGSIWLLREAWPSPVDIWEIYGEDGELEGSVRIEGPSDHESWDPRLRILRANRNEGLRQVTPSLARVPGSSGILSRSFRSRRSDQRRRPAPHHPAQSGMILDSFLP